MNCVLPGNCHLISPCNTENIQSKGICLLNWIPVVLIFSWNCTFGFEWLIALFFFRNVALFIYGLRHNQRYFSCTCKGRPFDSGGGDGKFCHDRIFIFSISSVGKIYFPVYQGHKKKLKSKVQKGGCHVILFLFLHITAHSCINVRWIGCMVEFHLIINMNT